MKDLTSYISESVYKKERYFNDLNQGDIVLVLLKDDNNKTAKLDEACTGYVKNVKARLDNRFIVEIQTSKKSFSIYPKEFDTKFENLTAKVYTTIEELIKEGK